MTAKARNDRGIYPQALFAQTQVTTGWPAGWPITYFGSPSMLGAFLYILYIIGCIFPILGGTFTIIGCTFRINGISNLIRKSVGCRAIPGMFDHGFPNWLA